MTLQEFFGSRLSSLSCREDTLSYIVGVFNKYKSADLDLSKKSLTLEYGAAKESCDFSRFQNIGDWVLFSNSIFKEDDYSNTIGRLSYYKCYKLVKSWVLFEELADNLEVLEKQIRDSLLKR